MADAEAAAPAAPAAPAYGRLLVCGATDWSAVGRLAAKDASSNAELPNLLEPHRMATLDGVNIVFIASGSAASHSVCIDDAGRVYTWGRNEFGQLGHGDRVSRNAPTLVPGLAGIPAVHAACGKGHTVVVAASGEAYAFGANKCGQLGSGSVKNKPKEDDVALSPVKCALTGAVAVAAGAEFTAWVTKDGDLLTAGLPQYGQLGHGADHEYNAKEGTVKLAYSPQPVPTAVAALRAAGAKIVKVALGHNHCVAVDAEGKVYTWGNGGYGRLGHKEQKDEWLPKQVVIPGGDRNRCPADAVVAAGTTSSFVSAAQGQVYYWGKIKTSGDNAMYPRPLMDLSGWQPRGFSAGAATFAVCADSGAETSTITWGGASYGELGYGPKGKKSSANPEKVPSLEGIKVLSVACGTGHTLFLADAAAADALAKLPAWTPPADAPPADAEGGAGGAGKDAGGKAPRKRKTAAETAAAKKR